VGRDRRRDQPRLPDVSLDKELVDAMTTRMVLRPKSIDTVVAPTCTPTS